MRTTIDQTYHQAITINSLSDQVYLSPNYLRSIFKEKTGMTIHDYLTRIRLNKAKELLADDSLKVQDIAQRVGYESTSYFISLFLKAKELRRMNTAKTSSPSGPWSRLAGLSVRTLTRIHQLAAPAQVLFIFLIVIILPFSLLIYYSYSSTRSTITEHTYTALGGSLAQINTNVEKRLEYYNQLSNILYMDAQLRNYLSTDYEQAYYYLDAFQYINRTLPSLMTLNANILGITIYTGNHTLYSDGQYVKYTEELPRAMEEQVLDAAGNTVYFHSGNFKADDAHITIARSLSYFSLQHPYGILTMDINANEFYS